MALHPYPKLPLVAAALLNSFHIPPQVAEFVSRCVCGRCNGAGSDTAFILAFSNPNFSVECQF